MMIIRATWKSLENSKHPKTDLLKKDLLRSSHFPKIDFNSEWRKSHHPFSSSLNVITSPGLQNLQNVPS